ncbi:hypothetical protein DKL61_10580 [Gammaproteobacteria bacterium ESL0073]|nr:hypothetical protein DKL61_10580 [Gammaproteobacteria bacterium ESL0073]
MTKLAYALCLMMPLLTLAQTNKKESVYADSCNAFFEASDSFISGLEKNKFTSIYITQQKKIEHNKMIDQFKQQLASIPKKQQVETCDIMSKTIQNKIQQINNVKSDEDIQKLFPQLKN